LNFLTVVLTPIIIVYAVTAFAVSRKRKSGMPVYICAIAVLLGIAAAGHVIYTADPAARRYELLHDLGLFAAMGVLALALRQYIHGAIKKAREGKR